MVSHAVSHAVSYILITTTVNNKLDTTNAIRFHNLITKIASDIISLVHVLHHVSLGTCTQCVPVALLANGDQFLDRSDRASNTSFVCWQSNVRFYLCKIRIYFLQFQNLPPLFASQEALSIDSSPPVISKQLQCAGSKEFALSHLSALLKNNSGLSVRGR